MLAYMATNRFLAFGTSLKTNDIGVTAGSGRIITNSGSMQARQYQVWGANVLGHIKCRTQDGFLPWSAVAAAAAAATAAGSTVDGYQNGRRKGSGGIGAPPPSPCVKAFGPHAGRTRGHPSPNVSHRGHVSPVSAKAVLNAISLPVASVT